jgi:hypothetical protein
VFWPKLAHQIEDLVDALIEKQFPFVSVHPNHWWFCSMYLQILCNASPVAIVPDELVTKINASGIGKAAAWAPQQYIMTHPVRSSNLPKVKYVPITLYSLNTGDRLVFDPLRPWWCL